MPEIGYNGITVHWELERPGYLVLHCEPYPRIGKKKEHDPEAIAVLRDLKARVTQKLRKVFAADLREDYMFDIDRVSELKDFSGNKVLGFDLKLPKEHRPEYAIAILLELIEYYTPVVDAAMAEVLSGQLRHVKEARMHL